MIDILLKAKKIEKQPLYGIPLGILFATIGMLFAVLIFKEAPSFPTIFLTTLAAAPIAIRLIKEEKLEEDFLKRHRKVIKTYTYLFFGMMIAFAIWYAILPSGFSNLLFKEQSLKFAAGYFTGSDLFSSIVINNIGLLFFFFLLSLFYGSGAIFLLAWNASILGVMWGNVLKTAFSFFNPTFVINTILTFPYLFPEVLAYFIAAVAGGIVSVNIIQKKRLKIAMKDSLILLGISITMILIAGLIEVAIIS